MFAGRGDVYVVDGGLGLGRHVLECHGDDRRRPFTEGYRLVWSGDRVSLRFTGTSLDPVRFDGESGVRC